jgi:hypothetical protein
MTDAPAHRDRVGAADLEYDLAHDGVTGVVPSQGAPPSPDRPGTLVSNETPDVGSDYGYDLAHDIPKPGASQR